MVCCSERRSQGPTHCQHDAAVDPQHHPGPEVLGDCPARRGDLEHDPERRSARPRSRGRGIIGLSIEPVSNLYRLRSLNTITDLGYTRSLPANGITDKTTKTRMSPK
jgi:hypothetical protein